VNEVVRKRFCKKQQMQCPKRGASAATDRVRTLNGNWPTSSNMVSDLDMQAEESPIAA